MFGGTGATTLNSGSGNHSLPSAYNATQSKLSMTTSATAIGMDSVPAPMFMGSQKTTRGHDAIANFQVNADRVRIAPKLDDHGITSAAHAVSGATFRNGNTVPHLSPTKDITLFGSSEPSTLVNSILVS
jgi:hypothetical protein